MAHEYVFLGFVNFIVKQLSTGIIFIGEKWNFSRLVDLTAILIEEKEIKKKREIVQC